MIKNSDIFEVDELLFDQCTLPSFPGLPRILILPQDRMFYIRNCRKEDAEWLFGLLYTACKLGKGYGLHEHPHLGVFKTSMLMKNHCLVFHLMVKKDLYRQKDGGVVSHRCLMANLKDQEVLESLDLTTYPRVAATLAGKSWQVRSQSIRAGETSLIVDPRYRNQKLGRELLTLDMGILKELGFQLMLTDTLTSNIQLTKALSNSLGNVTDLGIIPNSCYAKDQGWVGQKLQLFDFTKSSYPTFHQVIDENNTQALKAISVLSAY